MTVMFLMLTPALVGCPSRTGIDRFIATVRMVEGYYQAVPADTYSDGFLNDTTYARLRSAVSSNADFLGAVRKYYQIPDDYFTDFRTYSLAFSLYTFQIALGDQTPDAYKAKITDALAQLETSAAATDLTDQQVKDIRQRIASLKAIQTRLDEYSQKRASIDDATMREIADHLDEMNGIYGAFMSSSSRSGD